MADSWLSLSALTNCLNFIVHLLHVTFLSSLHRLRACLLGTDVFDGTPISHLLLNVNHIEHLYVCIAHGITHTQFEIAMHFEHQNQSTLGQHSNKISF